MTLDQLSHWFGGNSWDVQSRGNTIAVDLNYTIELALAELSQRDITEAELRDELRPLVTP